MYCNSYCQDNSQHDFNRQRIKITPESMAIHRGWDVTGFIYSAVSVYSQTVKKQTNVKNISF